jgi:hypothetical protein
VRSCGSRYPTTLWGYSAPDFARIAEAFGITGRTVSDPAQTGAADDDGIVDRCCRSGAAGMMAHETMTQVLSPETAAGRPTASAIERALRRRRDAVAALWGLRDEIVLIGAGEPVPIPGRGDQVYPFRAHSEYFYLSDRDDPGAVLAFDPQEGWTHFRPDVTANDRLWSGAGPAEGPTRSMLGGWLDERRGRPLVSLAAPVGETSSDMARQGDLRQALDTVRRPKDDVEIGRMRAAAEATRLAYEAVRPLIHAGVSERRLQIEIDAAFFRNGGDRTAYDTIIAGGPNAAVLHFTPTARVLHDGELVLIDAGAEFQNYACDVTRTYAVSGELRPSRRTSMRSSRALNAVPSSAAAPRSSTATSTSPPRPISRAASWTSAYCAAIRKGWSTAARARCSFRMASDTWSGSACGMSADTCRDGRAGRTRRCGSCASICRCRKAMR